MAPATLEKPEPGKPERTETLRDAEHSSNLDFCVQDQANVYVSPAGTDMEELLAGGRQHKHYEFPNIGVDELVGKVEDETGMLTPEREDCGNGIVRLSYDSFLLMAVENAVERARKLLGP